tara:strand:- start:2258 stop:2575 length:318 start_codon:yes stop_codon:yes gene_type:complete
MLALILSTFTTIFLAELGDKTQVATVAISGSSKRPLAVFLGSSVALVLASLVGVIAGGAIARLIPDSYLKLLSAIGLLFIGLKLIWPINSVNITSEVISDKDKID